MTNVLDLHKLLGCPRCRMVLQRDGGDSRFSCVECGYAAIWTDGVLVAGDRCVKSYFDDRFEVMQEGHRTQHGEFEFCYAKQIEYVSSVLGPGKVALDVGCGPGICYRRDQNCTLIGLDPSFKSIQVNKDVDLRVFGTAKEVPLQSHSVDAIVCFYSIHHMIGSSQSQTRANVAQVFGEFARVLKPDGDLLIAEMNPGPLAWLSQRVFWNLAKFVMRSRLDQYFWAPWELSRLGSRILPKSQLTVLAPRVSPWLMIPPVFTLPWLKVPRILLPLQTRLFHWSLKAQPQSVRNAA